MADLDHLSEILSMSPLRPYTFVALLVSAQASILLTHLPLSAQIELAKDAPKPLSPEGSLERFHLVEDLTIELVASEPLIADPTAVCWDERGRLFVCELHGYNLEGWLDVQELNKTGKLDRQVRRIPAAKAAREAAKKQQYGTLKLLEDDDGDGRMDRASVWADRLPPCYGIVPARGGIVVVCAPEILFFADRDGDGRAEVREMLFSGLGVTVLERGVNNPRWGTDGWIYVANGGAEGSVSGPKLDGTHRIGRSVFRIRADGSAIELANGVNHTFGIALTDFDHVFSLSTGDLVRYAIPLPRRYLTRNPHSPTPRTEVSAPGQWGHVHAKSPAHPWRVARGSDPAWIRFYGAHETKPKGNLTAGCGPMFYRDRRLPERYHGSHFACDPQQNIVRRSIVEPDGAGFRVRSPEGDENREFLASEETWFRPINLATGPDGAIYVVDMYREIIEYYDAIPRFLQQQYNLIHGDDRGRIWRIRQPGPYQKRETNLAKLGVSDLVNRLGHESAWHRLTAQRLLIERADRSTPKALREFIANRPSELGHLHALETLDGLGRLTESDVVLAFLKFRAHSPNFAVRALRKLDRVADEETALSTLSVAAASMDPRVRLQAALSLGELSSPEAARLLTQLASIRGNEPWMDVAILSGLGDNLESFAKALGSNDGPKLPGKIVQAIAFSIGARRETSEIGTLLASLAGTRHASNAKAAALESLSRGLSQSKARPFDSESGLEAIGLFLASPSEDVRKRALEIASKLGQIDAPPIVAAFSRYAELARSAEADLEKRLAAVEVLGAAPRLLFRRTLDELLDPRIPDALQVAVCRAWAGRQETDLVGTILTRWSQFTPNVREAVLEAVFVWEARVYELLSHLESGAIDLSELSALRRERLETFPDGAVRIRFSLVASKASARPTEIPDAFRAALATKKAPDLALGRTLFQKHCSTCHRAEEHGHAVGPDLASTQSHLTDVVLLDILRPSQKMSSGFDTYTVVTKQGTTQTGVVAAESPTSVTLRQAEGKDIVILRTNIARMQRSATSLMPDKLADELGPEGVAAVIAYLRQVYGKPTKLRRLEHEDVQLTGQWDTERLREYSKGVAALTVTHGDKAKAEFEGTAIWWIGAKTYNGGVFRWTIDRGTPKERSGQVNTYIKDVDRFTRVLLTSGLAPGKHTVEIEMISGKEIYLDALEVAVPLE